VLDPQEAHLAGGGVDQQVLDRAEILAGPVLDLAAADVLSRVGHGATAVREPLQRR
jgi:hypothetical protein